MAQITQAGFLARRQDGWRDLVTQAFQQAYGADLLIDGKTQQGQLIGSLARLFNELEQNLLRMNAGQSILTAESAQLDDLGALFQIPRQQATRSEVQARVSGISGALVPVGARARTQAGAVFRAVEPILIPAAGTATGTFEAEQVGPVAAGIQTLTQVASVVAGWHGITNEAPAQLGRNAETDEAYRRRVLLEIPPFTSGTTDGVRARIRAVEGVQQVIVRDNRTSAAITRDGVTIKAYGVMCIVRGGADADIAQAI